MRDHYERWTTNPCYRGDSVQPPGLSSVGLVGPAQARRGTAEAGLNGLGQKPKTP